MLKKLLPLLIVCLLLVFVMPSKAQAPATCYNTQQQPIPCPQPGPRPVPDDGRINKDVIVNGYGALALYCIDPSGKPSHASYAGGEIRVLNQDGKVLLSASEKAIKALILPSSLLASNQPINPANLPAIEADLESLEANVRYLLVLLHPGLMERGPTHTTPISEYVYPTPNEVGDALTDYRSRDDVLEAVRVFDILDTELIDTARYVDASRTPSANIETSLNEVASLVGVSALVPENGITAGQRARFEAVLSDLNAAYDHSSRGVATLNRYRAVLVINQPILDWLSKHGRGGIVEDTDWAKSFLTSYALPEVKSNIDVLSKLLNRKYVHSDSDRDIILVKSTPIYSLFASTPQDFVLTSVPDTQGKAIFYRWHGCG